MIASENSVIRMYWPLVQPVHGHHRFAYVGGSLLRSVANLECGSADRLLRRIALIRLRSGSLVGRHMARIPVSHRMT